MAVILVLEEVAVIHLCPSPRTTVTLQFKAKCIFISLWIVSEDTSSKIKTKTKNHVLGRLA